MAIIGSLIKTTKSSGICIDEYNGRYSVMSAWENREGEVKPNFVKTLPRKDGEEGKVVPVKMLLGESKAEAIGKLKCLIDVLEGVGDQGPVDDDSIPF
jgi:hypothetical protein